MLQRYLHRIIISIGFTLIIVTTSIFLSCQFVSDLLDDGDDSTNNNGNIKTDTSLMQLPVLETVTGSITGNGSLVFNDGITFDISNYGGDAKIEKVNHLIHDPINNKIQYILGFTSTPGSIRISGNIPASALPDSLLIGYVDDVMQEVRGVKPTIAGNTFSANLAGTVSEVYIYWQWDGVAKYKLAAADRTLEVPFYCQFNTQYCWATVTGMLLHFHYDPPGFEKKLWEIAATLGINADAGISGIGYYKGFYRGHGYYTLVQSQSGANPERSMWLSLSNLGEYVKKTVTEKGQPVALFLSGEGHMVLAVGWQGDNVILHDPAETRFMYRSRSWNDIKSHQSVSWQAYYTMTIPKQGINKPTTIEIGDSNEPGREFKFTGIHERTGLETLVAMAFFDGTLSASGLVWGKTSADNPRGTIDSKCSFSPRVKVFNAAQSQTLNGYVNFAIYDESSNLSYSVDSTVNIATATTKNLDFGKIPVTAFADKKGSYQAVFTLRDGSHSTLDRFHITFPVDTIVKLLSITPDTTIGEVGVQYTWNLNHEGSPTNIRYEWDFDDGGTETTNDVLTVSHTYDLPSIYTITVKAFNDKDEQIDEATAVAFMDLLLIDPENMVGKANQEYRWTADIDYIPDNMKFKWYMGDGKRKEVDDFKYMPHTYAQDGSFPITLEIYNNRDNKLVHTANASATIGESNDIITNGSARFDLAFGDRLPLKFTVNKTQPETDSVRIELFLDETNDFKKFLGNLFFTPNPTEDVDLAMYPAVWRVGTSQTPEILPNTEHSIFFDCSEYTAGYRTLNKKLYQLPFKVMYPGSGWLAKDSTRLGRPISWDISNLTNSAAWSYPSLINTSISLDNFNGGAISISINKKDNKSGDWTRLEPGEYIIENEQTLELDIDINQAGISGREKYTAVVSKLSMTEPAGDQPNEQDDQKYTETLIIYEIEYVFSASQYRYEIDYSAGVNTDPLKSPDGYFNYSIWIDTSQPDYCKNVSLTEKGALHIQEIKTDIRCEPANPDSTVWDKIDNSSTEVIENITHDEKPTTVDINFGFSKVYITR